MTISKPDIAGRLLGALHLITSLNGNSIPCPSLQWKYFFPLQIPLSEKLTVYVRR